MKALTKLQLIKREIKAQLIKLFEDQRDYAVAARAGAYAAGHEGYYTYHRGRVDAFEKAIKIVKETL